MRPFDASSTVHHLLAMVILCLCCGVRALRRECRWRFDNCFRPAPATCIVLLRQWCPRNSTTRHTDACETTALMPTNETRQGNFDEARALLSTGCKASSLDLLCPTYLCHLRTKPCEWSPFRVVRRSCAIVVKSRTRKPCCHPVTGRVIQCPCRVLNASCPFVSTFNSLIYTLNVNNCPMRDSLKRIDRSRRGIRNYNVEISLLGVVILLFLIFCSIIGVRRHREEPHHATTLKQPADTNGSIQETVSRERVLSVFEHLRLQPCSSQRLSLP